MSNDRDWDEFQNWTRQLAGAIKGTRPAEGWPNLLGNVALNLGARTRAAPRPDLRDPDLYLDFFTRTMDFASVPDLSRHPLEAGAGISGGREVWAWNQGGVGEGVRNPEWY